MEKEIINMPADAQSRYCPKCHLAVPLADKVRCSRCGTKLEAITPAVQMKRPTADDVLLYQRWLQREVVQ